MPVDPGGQQDVVSDRPNVALIIAIAKFGGQVI